MAVCSVAATAAAQMARIGMLMRTAADDPIGQARGSAWLNHVPMIRLGTIRLGTAFCLVP